SGDRVAFFGRIDNRFTLLVVDRTGKLTGLGGSARDPEGIAWLSDSELVVGLAEKGQSANLHRVDLSGHWRTMLHVPAFRELHDAAPDGRLLIARLEQRHLAAGMAPGDASERDQSWFDLTVIVDASPDGRVVLLGESGDAEGKEAGMYLRKTDG